MPKKLDFIDTGNISIFISEFSYKCIELPFLLKISFIPAIGLIFQWYNPHLFLENNLNLFAFPTVVLRSHLFEHAASTIDAFLAISSHLVDHLEVNIIMLLLCLSVSVWKNCVVLHTQNGSCDSIRNNMNIVHMWF